MPFFTLGVAFCVQTNFARLLRNYSTPIISTSECGSRESLQQWVFIDIKKQSESDNQDISTTKYDNYG